MGSSNLPRVKHRQHLDCCKAAYMRSALGKPTHQDPISYQDLPLAKQLSDLGHGTSPYWLSVSLPLKLDRKEGRVGISHVLRNPRFLYVLLLAWFRSVKVSKGRIKVVGVNAGEGVELEGQSLWR